MKVLANSSARPLLLLLTLGLALSSLALVSNFSPFIPDFDGLHYFQLAEQVREWILGKGDGKLWIANSNSFLTGWPITNGPSVYFVAFFGELLNKNIAPVAINTIYLATFSWYVARIRGPWYALAACALLCAHSLFFRLFTTLTTEFGVGLWLVAFLITIDLKTSDRKWALWALVPIGLAMRTIDVVFVFCTTFAYLACQLIFFRRPGIFKNAAWQIGAPLLICVFVLWSQIETTFDYMQLASTGFSAAAWKSLAGVETRSDVVIRYFEYLWLYNPLVPSLFAIALVSLFRRTHGWQKDSLQVVALAVSVMTPLLLAASLNIQVVFWVYAAMVFSIIEIIWITARDGVTVDHSRGSSALKCLSAIILIGALGYALPKSWAREAGYLAELSEQSQISRSISSTIKASEDIRSIATNYAGNGPLGNVGIGYASGRLFQYGGVRDFYTKNLDASSYVNFDESLNLFVAARENYSFPVHFGINDRIAETNAFMAKNGESMGFRQISSVVQKGKAFDLWYRPGIVVFPEFAATRDPWIAERLSFQVGTSSFCGDRRVSGTITLDLMFPSVAATPTFAPPFKVSVVDSTGNTLYQTSVGQAGTSQATLALQGVPCGELRAVFDKSFSSSADPRRLSAILQGYSAKLRFDAKSPPI